MARESAFTPYSVTEDETPEALCRIHRVRVRLGGQVRRDWRHLPPEQQQHWQQRMGTQISSVVQGESPMETNTIRRFALAFSSATALNGSDAISEFLDHTLSLATESSERPLAVSIHLLAVRPIQ